ncbi:MAG: TonB-dependent receptor, partial [Saprospiraceae bacterium]
VHNRSYNLFRLRNLNAAAPYPLGDPNNVAVRSIAEADASRPIPILNGNSAVIGGDTLYGVARNVVMSETEGESRYYGASFNLQRDRGAGNFAWRLNYTLSFLENNTEDINFRAMDANDFEAEWGPSINDRRHIISGIGSYYPLGGLGITLAALVQSGQPVNRIPDAAIYGTTDLNGDGASFGDAYVGNSDRYPGQGRNSDRLPWSHVFDLSAHYQFQLGENALEIRADVFNILNTQNMSGYSNNATQSNQIQIGAPEAGIVQKNAGAPRQFQFGMRVIF